jgi:hypothetical protein
MTVLAWILIAYMTVSGIGAVVMVGKPRKPLTGGDAAAIVLINAAFIAALAVWGL